MHRRTLFGVSDVRNEMFCWNFWILLMLWIGKPEFFSPSSGLGISIIFEVSSCYSLPLHPLPWKSSVDFSVGLKIISLGYIQSSIERYPVAIMGSQLIATDTINLVVPRAFLHVFPFQGENHFILCFILRHDFVRLCEFCTEIVLFNFKPKM